ncbi:MAG: DUF202 domain-containing protein [Lachnospiraceae bacterium]|nr:DUF202 domain-containing protein [Candidatus Merdinaster equi]
MQNKKTKSNAIMQSELSIERTKLANRRTLLSHIRSSIALIVAGAGLLKFIQDPIWIVTGYICLALAPILLIIGIVEYVRMKKLIAKEADFLNSAEDSENI